MDILSTSSINQAIINHKKNETIRKINPLTSRKNLLNNVSSAWNQVSSKLSSLQTTLTDLKVTSNNSIFNSKKVALSSSTYFNATADKTATNSAYSLKVNQLAKNDMILSQTQASSTSSGIAEAANIIQIKSGDYSSNLDVATTGTETYDELMKKLTTAINSDKATVTSSGSGSYTNSGTLSFDVNGTSKEIVYDYSAGKTYTEVVDDLVSQINTNVDGVEATNESGNLKITVTDNSKYITISDSSGNIGASLGLNITKEKSASALSSAATFTQSTNNSKFSLSAKDSGYDNRLIIEDKTGSVLNKIGLTSTILTDRTTKVADDNAAGYSYLANSSSSNGLNSKFLFNGINVQRNTNSFSDLVTGVTINLVAEMDASASAVSMNVSNDDSSIKAKVEEFITNFNGVYNYMRNNTYSDTSGRGLFVGDSSASSLMNSLRESVMGAVSGIDDTKINRLSKLGITFDPGTGLSLSNSSTLLNAINSTPDQVAGIFNSDNGIATKMNSFVNNFVGSTGSIASFTQSNDRNVKYITDKITSINSSIDKGAKTLRTKYERLQVQYAQMLNMSNVFSQSSGFY